MRIDHPDTAQLPSLARLAANCQTDPQRYIAYLGDDSESIAADVSEVDAWQSHTWIATESDRLAGWVLAETDPDMGRVWWWGPFTRADGATDISRALLEVARSSLSGFDEEEMVADERSSLIPSLAEEQGFVREEGSALLVNGRADRYAVDASVVPMGAEHRDRVVSIHDLLFPGTHTSGAALVRSDDDRRTIVVAVGEGDVIGYAVGELQNDMSFYIDFLGVDPAHRGRRVGSALVRSVCAIGSQLDATFVHLSVRETNTAARRLYASVGFTEERVIVPFRRGFSLS